MAPQPGTPRPLRSFSPHDTEIISIFPSCGLAHSLCSIARVEATDSHPLSLGFSEQECRGAEQ